MSTPDCSPGQYWEGEVVASALQSAAGDSGVLDGFASFSRAKVLALIQSAAGSGNISFFLEETVDGSNWSLVANSASTPYTVSTTNMLIVIPVASLFAKRLRIRWTLSPIATASPLTFDVRMLART